jgi:hypothetical protein
MTTKSDYNDEEWQLLLDIPMFVGAAVMVSGKSGLGTLKESFTLAHENMSAVKDFPNNDLIQSIVSARTNNKEKSSIESFSHPMLKMQPDDFKDAVVQKCREADALLKQKSTPSEAHEYRTWITTIADKVAHAASEGGILGIGGEQFSEPEKIAINDINSALGLG